jgi:hypothetical protein
MLPLLQAGTRVLLSEHFDLIYFSTTAFRTFLLAPLWKAITGCKIVFDFQDPWHPGDQLCYTRENAPGNWWKYRLSHALSKYEEPIALSAADHIISVSEGYVRTLSDRYRFLPRNRFSVIPFGAAPQDYALAHTLNSAHKLFDPLDGNIHWVYVGRGGPDMVPALRALFSSFAALRNSSPALYKNVHFHFIGTNYSPEGSTYKVVTPVATECGVNDCVYEHPVRIPYLAALAAMAESHGVLLLGSTSRDYTASKLFNCICSEKPLLAFFHTESLVAKILPQFPSAHLATFHSSADEPGFQPAARAGLEWLRHHPPLAAVSAELLAPYTAAHLTARQCAVFDSVTAV